MAQTRSVPVEVTNRERIEQLEIKITELDGIICDLLKQVDVLNDRVLKRYKQQEATINNVENMQPYEDTKLRLNLADKIQSAKNAAAILPPNLIVDGRHSKENIGAICGFIVDDDMWDMIYDDLKVNEDQE